MVAYKNICARLMRLLAQINIFLPQGLAFYEARALCVNLLQAFVLESKTAIENAFGFIFGDSLDFGDSNASRWCWGGAEGGARGTGVCSEGDEGVCGGFMRRGQCASIFCRLSRWMIE